jgi:hypothetical protein
MMLSIYTSTSNRQFSFIFWPCNGPQYLCTWAQSTLVFFSSLISCREQWEEGVTLARSSQLAGLATARPCQIGGSAHACPSRRTPSRSRSAPRTWLDLGKAGPCSSWCASWWRPKAVVSRCRCAFSRTSSEVALLRRHVTLSRDWIPEVGGQHLECILASPRFSLNPREIVGTRILEFLNVKSWLKIQNFW